MAIVIVGLGPGDAGCLTQEAWQILSEATEIYLRTREHPMVSVLPSERVHTFDDVYAREEQFAAIYEEIARRVVALGERLEGVVYAVPGHPRVGEQTTPRIEALAKARGIPVRIVDGLSFLEPVLNALHVDPLEQVGLQIVDAMVIAQRHHPPLDPTVPALIAQCYNRAIASDVKLTLLNAYPDEHPVIVLSAIRAGATQIQELPLVELDRIHHFDDLTTLYIPPVAPGGSVTELQEVLAHLRAPEGCPWDREQTHESLRANLLEETYEVLDALDRGDADDLCEELGDLLMQVVFHTQIAAEGSEFRMADVARGIVTKLWRRHPHVFGDVTVDGVDEVLRNWEAIKAGERKKKPGNLGLLSGIPQGLPALAQAQAYLGRAESLGQSQPDSLETAARLLASLEGTPNVEEQLGQLLLIVANWARRRGVDAESALRAANVRLSAIIGQPLTGAFPQSAKDLSTDQSAP